MDPYKGDIRATGDLEFLDPLVSNHSQSTHGGQYPQPEPVPDLQADWSRMPGAWGGACAGEGGCGGR